MSWKGMVAGNRVSGERRARGAPPVARSSRIFYRRRRRPPPGPPSNNTAAWPCTCGTPRVSREGRVVLKVKDLLLQGGRDHHLVSTVGGRAAAEDPIGILEERDVPPIVQDLHDLLTVAVRGLGE